MQSDFVIVVRTWQTVFFLSMQCCRNTAALMKCKNMSIKKHEMNKSAFADPRMWSYLSETHFLIRLRRRFYDVPI